MPQGFVCNAPKYFLESLAEDVGRVKDGVVRVCSVPLAGRRSALVFARAYLGTCAMKLTYRVPRAGAEAALAALEADVRRLGLAVRPARVEGWMATWSG